MIVRSLGEVKAGKGNVETEWWSSRRFLLQEDGLGFTLTETIIEAGAEMTLHYKNHFEACLCIEGQGEVTGLEPAGPPRKIEPGTMYALDRHDRHTLKAETRMKLVCVFNPALTGQEVHRQDGSYGAAD